MLLGIDRGSLYTKAVLISGGRILKKFKVGSETPFYAGLGKIFENLKSLGVKKLKACFLNFNMPGVKTTEPFKALKRFSHFFHPEIRSIIEIGGERIRFLQIGEGGETEHFSLSEKCASGTGLFIEQQCQRLQISIEEFSCLALQAKRPAKIAGRCAVFAKSDMIHLQQKGVPLEEIVYGLCFSIATNIILTLTKGREAYPLLIAGGCSENEGILRAFKEILMRENIIKSALPGFEGAFGSALEAENSEEVEIAKLMNELSLCEKRKNKIYSPPLKPVKKLRFEEPERNFDFEVEGYIGVDVGSVSTNIVVLSRDGDVLSGVYLPTRGKPVEVLREGFSIIRKRFKGGLRVLGSCATGSGRYVAQALLNADMVKNEINSQMKGALHYFPDADTIFEIGGQDSKYIFLENGILKDFAMNKICSAGTGSFIEEQVKLLNLDVKKEFSELSFRCSNPLSLSSNCTVFMEKAISSSLLQNESIESICAGIARAIVSNYLEKVVGRRKIGRKIVFQGGVASNDAVVSAFEDILGRELLIHPYNRLSGAIGAALLARENVKGKSSFVFPEDFSPRIKFFECKRCANFCDVAIMKLKGKNSFFGDACERYTSGNYRSESRKHHLAELYIKESEKYFETKEGERTIGIPRASVFLYNLPFWATFFRYLGFSPVLSPPSSRETLIKSSKLLQAVTCLPVKLLAGHIFSLLQKCHFVFLPCIWEFERGEWTCPYTQSLPSIMKRDGKFISPLISFSSEEDFLEGFSNFRKIFGFSGKILREAFRESISAQKDFNRKMKEMTEEELRKEGIKVVVIGRPYNIHDPYLNMSLFHHLVNRGFVPVPVDFFPHEEIENPPTPWKFTREGFKRLISAIKSGKIYPIILSNFGCGPDAFAVKIYEEVTGDFPSLFLEFDEHRQEAGLITRLEAFRDQVEEKSEGRKIHLQMRDGILFFQKKNPGRKIYIPYFSDHAYAYSGILKHKGFEAEVLPPPEEHTKRLGEKNSSGKECHAYSILLGDLVNLCKNEREKFIFFYPGTKLPCLIHEYPRAMEIFLRREEIDAEIYAPSGEEFVKLIGMKGIENFYRGLFAIDALHKAFRLIQPFEEERGESERIYRESLVRIERALEGGDVFEEFKRSILSLKGVRRKEEMRPLVGVAGDIYTRVNSSANFNLFEELIERGLAGIPSPFQIDIIDFGLSRDFYKSLGEILPRNLLKTGLLILRKNLELRKFYSLMRGIPHFFREPGYSRLNYFARKYTDNFHNELYFLNVAKIVHFAENGVCGLINATCLNCMIGSASSAIIEKIREDYKIPVLNLVYSTEKDPDIEVMLDAFANEVKEKFRREKGMNVEL